MNKLDYLKQLESALSGKITADELDDIIRDYAEYFEEGKKQGKTEDEISQKLGIPFEVAQQILTDEGEIKEEKKTNFFNGNFLSGAAAQFKKGPKSPKPPKEPAPPQEPHPPRPPQPPRQRREMGCLNAFFIGIAVLALFPLALIGVICLGSIFLAIIVAGLSLGIAGICAWVAISICSVFLPPIAAAAGVVIGLAMISVCVTVLSGILWGAVSLCKAIGRMVSGRREVPVPPTADNFNYDGAEASHWQEPHEPDSHEAKEEGDDQSC